MKTIKAYLVYTTETDLNDPIFDKLIDAGHELIITKHSSCIKTKVNHLMLSDLVITTMDWYKDPECEALVNVARIVGVEVKSLVRVLHDIKTNN